MILATGHTVRTRTASICNDGSKPRSDIGDYLHTPLFRSGLRPARGTVRQNLFKLSGIAAASNTVLEAVKSHLFGRRRTYMYLHLVPAIRVRLLLASWGCLVEFQRTLELAQNENISEGGWLSGP